MFSGIRKNIAFLISTLGNYRLFLPIFRMFPSRYPHLCDSTADICIEGFPRSGNTFFVALIQRWNPGIKINHHSHLAANAKFSYRHGIPTVVLIREPIGATASAMVWDGKITSAVGLFGYLSFYRSLKAYRGKVLFVRFDEFTKSPDVTIRRINAVLNTKLMTKEFDSKEQKKIASYLQRHDKRNDRSGLNASLPSAEKQEHKKEHENALKEHWLISSALRTYEEISQHAEVDVTK